MIDITPTIVDALYGVSNNYGLLETEPRLRGRSLLRYMYKRARYQESENAFNKKINDFETDFLYR